MIADLNKQIQLVEYNFLNLPQKVTTDLHAIDYDYDAAGTKLRKKVVQGNNTTTTDYIGGIHYINGSIDFIQTAEGRADRASDGTYTYSYFISDHLGNNRVTITTAGIITQVNDYYPFGLTFNSSASSPENLYKFNGKEEQEETGWLDYGARMYQPELGRWFNIDPLAEAYDSYSPYNYTLNNPILYIDPDGQYVDWSNISGKEKRVAKRALRRHKSSGQYKNLYKQLKKSDGRYVVNRKDGMGTNGGQFEGNNKLNYDAEVDSESGEVISEAFSVSTLDGFGFGDGEKGGNINLNFEMVEGLKTKDQVEILSDFAVEEVVHAAQYDDNGNLPGTANTEFEAKAIVGQIASESRRSIWTAEVDKTAHSIGLKSFRRGSVNLSNYNSSLNKWHSDPRLSGNYKARRRTNATPQMLIRLVKRKGKK